MGDLLTLIEQAERTWSEQQAEDLASKMAGGDFTLDDFLEQLNQIRKMGSMKKLMGMLPGMGQYREALEEFDEREIDRQEAIIKSMTPAERADTRILNGSRRLRIANGSGTTVTEVNQLVDRFEQAKKVMTSMSRGGMPNIPGMPNMPGMGGGYTKRQNKKKRNTSGSKKGRSGNPAKRRQQELAAQREAEAKNGSAFGGPQAKPEVDMEELARFLK